MIKTRHGRIVIALFAVIAAAMVVGSDFSAAQGAAAPAAIGELNLLEAPQPDIAGVDPVVQEQIHAAQSGLAAALAQADASRVRRAKAFGNLGEIYQAYGFEDAALACYANATSLDSKSFRWFYYAGYLHQANGDTEAAARDFQHALGLKPINHPALLRLGNVELSLNHLVTARQWFSKAMAQQNSDAAALKYFTQALAREPQASSIHYQLAMTYRGLGDLARMKEQLEILGDVEPTIKDPLLDEIDVLKQGKFGLLERGTTAMRENRFDDAVAAYRQMVSLQPSDPVAYKYLGLALAASGKPDDALKEYAHSLQLDPNNATLHYNIGILLIEAGKEERAATHFQQAVQLDPGLLTAHFQLANLLMRKTRDADAEREYGVVVALEPQNAFARLMQAMASVHSCSYGRARKLLEDAAEALPDDADIKNALARILAAAPDPAVRDQDRALRIVESLVQNRQGDALEVGITLGMALAAMGRFQEAAAYQEAIIKQLSESRQFGLALPLRQDLARYQQGKTCRIPWADDDPIFTPAPSKTQLLTEAKTMSAEP
jgi:tetratricopeptide (TPR) repeat protein